jgi:hypothetical protein
MPFMRVACRRTVALAAPVVALLLACEGDGGLTTGPDGGASTEVDGGEPGAIDGAAATPAPAAPGPLERSGSRLKVVWVESPTGERGFARWHDSQLNTACSFRTADDQETRCLPAVAASVRDDHSEFSDPFCRTPALVFPRGSCAASPPYVSVDSSDVCHPKERIHNLGRRLDHYYAPFDGPGGYECLPLPLQPGETAYELGDAVPPQTFVPAVLEPQPSRDPAALQVLLAEAQDGGRYFAGWWHPEQRARCQFYPLSDGSPHCFTAPALDSGGFVDSACTRAGASYLSSCGQEPRQVLEPVAGVCPLTFSAWTPGPRQDTGYVRTGAGTCQASTGVGQSYYPIGAAIDATALPRIDYQHDEAGGRLRPLYVAAAGGPRARAAAWFDAQRGESCAPLLMGGAYRCAPPAVGLQYHYANAACTEPLLRTGGGVCPPRYALQRDPASCPERAYLLSVGAAYTGAVFVKVTITDDLGQTSIECPRIDRVGDDYYRVAPVREDDLAELREAPP